MTLSLVHTHAGEATEVEVRLPGADLTSHRVLGASDIRAHNTFEEPGLVSPREAPPGPRGGRIPLPPASVNVLEFRLEESGR